GEDDPLDLALQAPERAKATPLLQLPDVDAPGIAEDVPVGQREPPPVRGEGQGGGGIPVLQVEQQAARGGVPELGGPTAGGGDGRPVRTESDEAHLPGRAPALAADAAEEEVPDGDRPARVAGGEDPSGCRVVTA